MKNFTYLKIILNNICFNFFSLQEFSFVVFLVQKNPIDIDRPLIW